MGVDFILLLLDIRPDERLKRQKVDKNVCTNNFAIESNQNVKSSIHRAFIKNNRIQRHKRNNHLIEVSGTIGDLYLDISKQD